MRFWILMCRMKGVGDFDEYRISSFVALKSTVQEPSNVMLGRLGFGAGWVAKNVGINGKYPINHTISATM